jgi:hypothetical protein
MRVQFTKIETSFRNTLPNSTVPPVLVVTQNTKLYLQNPQGLNNYMIKFILTLLAHFWYNHLENMDIT